VTTQLKSKPGITGASTLAIPKDWDPKWFRHFINNQLKGGDVRNAIAGTGVTISGSIASPYATISATGSGIAAGPNGAIQYNNSGSLGGSANLIWNGSMLVGTASVHGSKLFEFTSTGGVPLYGYSDSGGSGITASDPYTASGMVYIQSGGEIDLYTLGNQRVSIGTAGNVTIAAPTSGVSLQVGGIAGQTYLNVGTTSDTTPVAQFIGAGVSRNALVLNANGVQATEFVQNFSGSTDSFGVPTNSYGIMGLTGTGNLIFGTNSLVRATISNGLQIGAPTGGDLGGGTINATGYYVNGVLLALPVRVIKTTLQSIASNVTPANDNTLVYAISATGTYAFKVVAYTYNTVSATVGIKCNVNYSGTFTAASSGEGIFSTGFSSFGAQVPAVVTAAIGFGNIGATAAGAATVVIDGSIVVTGAGTLGFAWSQNNTNATGTVVAAGSYLEVTKIA
jgi:hypothetical protein